MSPLDQIVEAGSQALSAIILSLPSILAAIIIIAVGYFVGQLVGRAVDRLIERTGVEKAFDATELGKAYRRAGIDISRFTGNLVWAFIVVLSIMIALSYLKIGGVVGQYIGFTAEYLVRIVGAVLVLTLGSALFELFATFVARQLGVAVPSDKAELVDMLKDVLFVGLLAFLLSIVFNILLLPGNVVYPLILGVAAIALGIAVSERIVDSIAKSHPEFAPTAGYAKFLLLLVFIIVGVAGIFGTVPGTSIVIEKVAWGIAIAAALLLVPVMYTLAKRMAREAK